MLLQAYQQISTARFCGTFMENYFKYPPIDIEDYISRDYAFRELCNPIYALMGYGIGIFLLVLGIKIGVKKKGGP